MSPVKLQAMYRTAEQVESEGIIISLILSYEQLLLFVSFVYHLPLYTCELFCRGNQLILTVFNFCRATDVRKRRDCGREARGRFCPPFPHICLAGINAPNSLFILSLYFITLPNLTPHPHRDPLSLCVLQMTFNCIRGSCDTGL